MVISAFSVLGVLFRLTAEGGGHLPLHENGNLCSDFCFPGENSLLTNEVIPKVGCLIHINPRIALRLGVVLFYNNYGERDNLTNDDTSTTQEKIFYGIRLDVFYYFNPGKKVLLYAGPGGGYEQDNILSYEEGFQYRFDETSYILGYLSFGMEYLFSSSVSLSIETGVGYRWADRHYQNYSTTTKLITTDTNTYRNELYLISPTIGFTFYFN